MGAFHIVGVDFQLRLGIGRRGAVEQHRLERLESVGALCVAGVFDDVADEAVKEGLEAAAIAKLETLV
jgi:hypothetical protein